MNTSYDVLVIGGGVIGLMTARDLASRGLTVLLLDKGPVGREASWAGAGIVPPAFLDHAHTPYERLRAVSYLRFPRIADELRVDTGIDVGFRRSGAIDIPESTEPRSQRASIRQIRTDAGVRWSHCDASRLRSLEPHLRAESADVIPDVCQIRNPRLLAALRQDCLARGVAILEHRPVKQILHEDGRAVGISTLTDDRFHADHLVMSAGAWSAEILEGLPGPALPLRPIRGQIEVFQTDGSTVRHIFFAGKSYVVPREDGLVLIGATEEDAGFDKSVTADGLASLHQFAINLIPRLADAPVIHSWAGLRPASAVGHPILGPWAGLDRLWIATGHFRHGLQQSPGTAQLIADWIVGSDTFARPEDFSLEAHPAQFVSAFHS